MANSAPPQAPRRTQEPRTLGGKNMQGLASLGHPGLELMLGHPQFLKVRAGGRATRGRPTDCPASRGSGPNSNRPCARARPRPQVLQQEATPASSADEADMLKRVCIKSPL